MTTDDMEDILDQLYIKIQQFLTDKIGEDLNQDLIDISLETTEKGELIVNIELFLELSPFSKYNVQEIAEEAVKHGIKEADQLCPPFIINIRG
ncbi:MAG: DUF3194 domain-containing protein [Promethearchaeota archaeon]